MVPRFEAWLGSTLDTRNTSSRRPSMALAMIRSAAPEPYISAVSICVIPRSSPRRMAAMASSAEDSSDRHDPWPTRGISRRVVPKGRRGAFTVTVRAPSLAEALGHPKGRLEPLIVALHDVQCLEAEAFIERARDLVIRTQFEIDAEHTRFEGGRREPLNHPAADTLATVIPVDREQIQMSDIVPEIHDGERRDAAIAPGDHDAAVAAHDGSPHARRRPRPGESTLDRFARHLRNLFGVLVPGEAEGGQLGHGQRVSVFTGAAGRDGKPEGCAGSSFINSATPRSSCGS